MDDFERLLKQSLEREDAPSGFDRRVLALTARRGFAWGKWGAIAATLVLAAGGVFRIEQERRERVAGEAAKAQFETALRITSAKLHKVQQTIDSLNEGF